MSFALLAQQNLRLSEYRGEVVMLSFWASWCGQCRQELPELDDLYQRYQKVGLTLLGVSIDDEKRKTEDMVRTLEVTFPVLIDERREVSRLYRVDDMPAVVLIDREGTVRYTHYGPPHLKHLLLSQLPGPGAELACGTPARSHLAALVGCVACVF